RFRPVSRRLRLTGRHLRPAGRRRRLMDVPDRETRIHRLRVGLGGGGGFGVRHAQEGRLLVRILDAEGDGRSPRARHRGRPPPPPPPPRQLRPRARLPPPVAVHLPRGLAHVSRPPCVRLPRGLPPPPVHLYSLRHRRPITGRHTPSDRRLFRASGPSPSR